MSENFLITVITTNKKILFQTPDYTLQNYKSLWCFFWELFESISESFHADYRYANVEGKEHLRHDFFTNNKDITFILCRKNNLEHILKTEHEWMTDEFKKKREMEKQEWKKMNKKERQKIIDKAITFSKQLDKRMKDANLFKESKKFTKKLSKVTDSDLTDIYRVE